MQVISPARLPRGSIASRAPPKITVGGERHLGDVPPSSSTRSDHDGRLLWRPRVESMIRSLIVFHSQCTSLNAVTATDDHCRNNWQQAHLLHGVLHARHAVLDEQHRREGPRTQHGPREVIHFVHILVGNFGRSKDENAKTNTGHRCGGTTGKRLLPEARERIRP